MISSLTIKRLHDEARRIINDPSASMSLYDLARRFIRQWGTQR